MRKFLLSFAVILTMAILPAEVALAQIPSTYFTEGETIVWKIKEIPAGRFPMVSAVDIATLTERFNRLYEAGFNLADLNVRESEGQWSLFIGDNKIFSVSEAHAQASTMSAEMIAINLMSRMYEALAGENANKLTAAHQIGGQYEAAATVSWYSESFIGKRFANGERVTRTHLAAAARSLPFGTLVKVIAPSGRYVVVRITDRFPGRRNRLLDVSPAAADLLGMRSAGVLRVMVKVIGSADKVGGRL